MPVITETHAQTATRRRSRNSIIYILAVALRTKSLFSVRLRRDEECIASPKTLIRLCLAQQCSFYKSRTADRFPPFEKPATYGPCEISQWGFQRGLSRQPLVPRTPSSAFCFDWQRARVTGGRTVWQEIPDTRSTAARMRLRFSSATWTVQLESFQHKRFLFLRGRISAGKEAPHNAHNYFQIRDLFLCLRWEIFQTRFSA